MNNHISHRGPDSSGVFVSGNTGVAHRRLSIIDLSTDADQPFHSFDDQSCIVFNGEVYNYIELRDELIEKGYKFKTTSDTEVVLASYLEWKEDCFHKFNGMWALAILDKKSNDLLLCRDRFGVKPLYYYEDKEYFAFASEKKALFLSDFFNIDFDKKGILTAQNNAFRLEASGFTEFKGIKSIKPGHFVKISCGQSKITKWYSLKDRIMSCPRDFSNNMSLSSQFENLFSDACKIRLRADVPFAAALSGGLDSSAVVAKVCQISSTQINAFVHTYPASDLDERKYADIVTNSFGLRTQYVTADSLKLSECIDDIIYFSEAIYPGMPDSAFRIYLNQNKSGFKISIDGHGADEMLAGYPWYLDEYQKDLPTLSILKHIELIKHFFTITDLSSARPRKSVILKKYIASRMPRSLFNLRNKLSQLYHKHEYHVDLERPPKHWSNLKSRLYDDFTSLVLPRILKNFDSLSMANSIEVRMPFLDYRLVEFVFSLPDKCLIQKGFTKFILREAVNDILDSRIVWRRDKKGFNSPIKEYLKGPLYEWSLQTIKLSDQYSSFIPFDATLERDFYSFISNPEARWEEGLHIWTRLNTIRFIHIFTTRRENA